MRLDDVLRAKGSLRAYERPAGTDIWRPAFEADNVVLNQWYVDLFGQISASPADRPGGVDPEFSLLALGYGVAVSPARTDTVLGHEWSSSVTRLTVATAAVPTTVLNVQALPLAIAAGEPIGVGINSPVLSAPASPGDTTITVVSYTPSAVYPIGTSVTYVNPTIHVPQRLALVVGTIDPTDPPSVTISYFLPAASNSEPITFTEAGLLYTSGSPLFGTHVAFSYTKGGNTDLRVDYLLSRESDE